MNQPADRTLLDTIQARKGRLPAETDLHGARYELRSLERSLSTAGEAVGALRRLVPVRVIACIEGSLKAAAALLIDHGDPYRANAKKLFRQIKIDFDLLSALLDKRVTVGDVVVHSIGWHDIDEIHSRMSTLLGTDFFDALGRAEDRFEIEGGRAPKRPIIDSIPTVLSDIAAAIDLRHKLCHEVSTTTTVPEDVAERFLKSGIQFVHATQWLTSETLHPGAPLTQTDINIAAGNKAHAAREELDAEIARLMGHLDDPQKAKLANCQQVWEQYRDAHATFESDVYSGGTIRPLIHAGELENLTRQRIKQVTGSNWFPR